jgi:hypothetical protein
MKRKIKWILWILIALIIIIATIVCFIYVTDKPMLAFFIACCAGVLVVNLILSVYLVNKNFKNKDGA